MQAWNDNLVALRMPRHATSLTHCLLDSTSKELRVHYSKCRTKLTRERKLLKNLVHMEKIRSDTAKMIWVSQYEQIRACLSSTHTVPHWGDLFNEFVGNIINFDKDDKNMQLLGLGFRKFAKVRLLQAQPC